MVDSDCPKAGNAVFVVQYFMTSAGSYALSLANSDMSFAIGPWTLNVMPSSTCAALSPVTVIQTFTAGEAVIFTIHCVDAYSTSRPCTDVPSQVIFVQQRGGACLSSGSCFSDASFLFSSKGNSSAYEANLDPISVSSILYDSISFASPGSSGLLATFYDGAALFASGTRVVFTHSLSTGFRFGLASNLNNAEFQQGAANSFAIRFSGLFMRGSSMSSILTHSRSNVASESIKIVIGGTVVLNSPAGSGGESQTFSLSQFEKGIWFDFVLEYSASNFAVDRSNSLKFASGVIVPSDFFAVPIHFSGSPYTMSVSPSSSNPKFWLSKGQNALQTVFPLTQDIVYISNMDPIRNMTVFVTPRDQFGNALQNFPDKHVFYLGKRVLGQELPYVSEAVLPGFFKILLSVV